MDKPNTWMIFQHLDQWHAWLVDHHQTQKELWIQIQKKQSKTVGLHLSEAVEEALCFGWIDGQMFSLGKDAFIIRMTPRLAKSPWSLINKNRALQLIEAGRMQPQGFRMIEVAKANGWWDKAYTRRK